VVWEGSAKRDPARFTDPDAFRVDRDPNPHLGLGHGVHFCLGSHLARLEIRVALAEILGHIDSFALTGPPEWTRRNRHSGIRDLPMRLHRRRVR
jgi:cytochrome P450